MPFLLKIECNGRHQLEAYLESSAAVFELVWNWSSCPIHSRSLMYFLQGWQYSVRFPHTSCARIHMIVRTQRTISEITFQMWDISIPDAQEDQPQVVQTDNIGMRASFAGIVCLYEDPIAHVLLCICTVSNSSIFIIRLVLQMLKS